MFDQLNLATRPFQNRVLPWAISLAVGFLSLLALILIAGDARQTTQQADAIEKEIEGSRAQMAALQRRTAQVLGALSPEEVRTLEAAHRMVDRRRFSWSRLLADLEGALPANVRVESVTIGDVLRSDSQTYAELDLSVVGREPSDVTKMINEMARAGVFEAVPTSQSAIDNRAGGGMQFELRVRYRPRSFVTAGRSETARAEQKAPPRSGKKA